MCRSIAAVFSLLLVLSQSPAQEAVPVPKDVQQHMEKMVGSWKFSGSEGDRKFFGAESIRLTNNKTAIIQEGYFDLGGGEKEHYVILSGWDGAKKAMMVRGFTSDGYTWTGKWKTLKNGKWKGTSTEGPATFEVDKDRMRYESSEDGVSWNLQFHTS